MNNRTLIINTLFILFFSAASSKAQDIDEVFIKENLKKTVYQIDSEADAVVLFESKEVEVSKDYHGGYQQIDHIRRVVKILNSNAAELANVRLFYRSVSNNSYIYKINGTTYNLAGNSVQNAEVDKNDIYKKEVRKNHFEVQFSLPAVKAGSIIDYSYDEVSPLSYLSKWDIQDKYPKLVSVFRISYPYALQYTSVSRVRVKIEDYKKEDDAIAGPDECAYVARAAFYETDVNRLFWIRKNIKGIKHEPYVSSIANNEENLTLQLTGYMTSMGLKHDFNTWEKLTEDLLKNEQFGKHLEASNNFLDDEVDSISRIAKSPEEKTRAIYNYVRANFTSTDNDDIFITTPLHTVFNKKQGSVAEINFLLCEMLLHAGIEAAPILTGDDKTISPSQSFPVLDRFRYVACAVKKTEGYVLLDASDKNNVYGMLPVACYNGYARIIQKDAPGLPLSSYSLKNRSLTGIKITNMNDSTADIEIVEKHGIIYSSQIRKLWAKDVKAKSGYLDKEIHNLPDNITITKTTIAFEQNPDTNLVCTFSGTISFDKNASPYFINSTLIKTFNENPFKAATRTLPIEFPYQMQEQYSLTMTLPDNITIPEVPEPAIVTLDSMSMTYKKTCHYFPNIHTLAINSTLNINNTIYSLEYYDLIRQFFQNMIKQENETITLNKTDKK